MMRTAATNEELKAGDEFDWIKKRVRVVRAITREEFVRDVEARRQQDRRLGKPPARSGIYTPEGEFKPHRDLQALPADMRFFYVIEPVF